MSNFNGWKTSGSESWIGTREEYEALVAAGSVSEEVVYHVIEDNSTIGGATTIYNVRGTVPMVMEIAADNQSVKITY